MGRRDLVFLAVCLASTVVAAHQLWRPPRATWPRTLVRRAEADPDFVSTLARVDAEFSEDWERRQLTPAARASMRTLARRLSLGLTGTIPSLEELRLLESVPDADQLDWWIAHLLEDRRFADYVGERLARAFVGTDGGPFIVYRRRRFVGWISDQLHEKNLAYDALVRRMISDDGLWTDDPAVNFLTATSDPTQGNRPDPIRLANRVTRAFLGLRIDCLQCHDDRLNKVKLGDPGSLRDGQQQDFHRLAAFFGKVENSIVGIHDNRKSTGYHYQFLHADEEQLVQPQVPFLPELAPSDGTLRQQLAGWITSPNNKPFARVTVNRFWALVFGRPLIEPIDEIPLHGPFPPGLEALADDFARHQFDVKRLVRLIASTKAFERDSQVEFEPTADHERYWAVFPLTRLRPEQVAGSVVQSSSLATIDADAHVVRKLMKFGETNEFVKRYGDMGEDEFTDRGGTIPQRLLMMNGELVSERTRENLVLNAATRVATLTPNNERAVEAAYLSVLTRLPTDDERRQFAAELQGKRGHARNQALEDLWWILINSTEFSWNH